MKRRRGANRELQANTAARRKYREGRKKANRRQKEGIGKGQGTNNEKNSARKAAKKPAARNSFLQVVGDKTAGG